MWITEWRAIKKRIGGIREAGVFFLRADTGEDHNSAGEIIGNVHETVQRLVHFNEIYGALLPAEAYLRVVAFLKRYNDTFGGLYPPGSPNANAYNGAVAVFTYPQPRAPLLGAFVAMSFQPFHRFESIFGYIAPTGYARCG